MKVSSIASRSAVSITAFPKEMSVGQRDSFSNVRPLSNLHLRSAFLILPSFRELFIPSPAEARILTLTKANSTYERPITQWALVCSMSLGDVIGRVSASCSLLGRYDNFDFPSCLVSYEYSGSAGLERLDRPPWRSGIGMLECVRDSLNRSCNRPGAWLSLWISGRNHFLYDSSTQVFFVRSAVHHIHWLGSNISSARLCDAYQHQSS